MVFEGTGVDVGAGVQQGCRDRPVSILGTGVQRMGLGPSKDEAKN